MPGWKFDILGAVRAWFADRGDVALAQRVAGGAFLIRVASAALLYLTQVALARWMGSHEFGIYIYVWTWVILVGGLFDLGLAQGAQRFIPEYAQRGRNDLLRGFLVGSRWLALSFSTAAAVLGGLLLAILSRQLPDYLIVPLALACLCVPFYSLTGVQDGIARSYNWPHLALVPPYILRPLLVLPLLGLGQIFGLSASADAAMLAALGATALAAVLQFAALRGRLRRAVPAGPKQYAVATWLKTSGAIFLVESFYLLLTSTDVLVLQHFRPPQDLAVYYAAAKTLALVAFVNFAVSAAVAHRFTECHVAGDRARLAAFLAQSIRWTFWPALGLTAIILALGYFFLRLFGPDFAAGYPLMFVLAVGLLARAAVGPAERLLNMLGEQNACALAYAAAFAINLLGCLILIPRYAAMGAAVSCSAAFVLESILLFIVTKRRLGLHVFIWNPVSRAGAAVVGIPGGH